MTDLLVKAFNKAQSLPEYLQDELARQLLKDIESELQWQQTLSQSQSSVLDEFARQALKDSCQGKTRVAGFDEL